jgi:MFS family permease
MGTGERGLTTERSLIILFFCIETFARTALMAIVPLDLLELLGNAQHVGFLFAAAAIFGLGNSILIPILLRQFGIKTLITAAGLFVVLAAALLSTGNVIGMALGLVVRVFASACVEIPLIAYIMDRIPRREIGAFEPKRIFFQGCFFAIAPWLGIQLREHISAGVPFALSAIGGVLISVLALTTLSAAASNAKAVMVVRRPAATIARFFEQPRLRLAWTLAVIRASFWVIFSIYAPIFSVTCEWSPAAGAAVLSLGNASLFLVAIWGRLARRLGARRVLAAGYALAASCLVLTAAAALLTPGIAPAFLLAAAFAASIIDGPGNIAFLRATRPRERSSMAGIYTTYRDVSQFVPIAVFSVILLVSQPSTAFFVLSGVMFGAARLSLLIHPRLR